MRLWRIFRRNWLAGLVALGMAAVYAWPRQEGRISGVIPPGLDEKSVVVRAYEVKDLVRRQVEFSQQWRRMGGTGSGKDDQAAAEAVLKNRGLMQVQSAEMFGGRLIVVAPPADQAVLERALLLMRKSR